MSFPYVADVTFGSEHGHADNSVVKVTVKKPSGSNSDSNPNSNNETSTETTNQTTP